MSTEEDIELKNLVAQALENKGVLPKIRAELRANVFLALEENPSTKDIIIKNDKLSAFLKVPIGTLVVNLIREFLEFFELEFTLSVFEPETKYGKEYNEIARDKIINELKITDSNKKNPLLFDVINKIINTNKLDTSKCENKEKEVTPNSQNEKYGSITLSPIELNTTFVKKIDSDSVKLNLNDKESNDDTNESVKEEIMSNNFSDGDSSSEVQLALDKISNFKPEQSLSSTSNKSNEASTPKAKPLETLEIDLLTFTPPVKDTKKADKIKSPSVDDNLKEINEEKKEKFKTLSVLSDLPPLNTQVEEKKFDMKDLKAMMDGWSEKKNLTNNKDGDDCEGSIKEISNKSSRQCKSEISGKSQNSEISEGNDSEENISDLESNSTNLSTPHTIDETISKTSCAADYLEDI